MKDIIILLLCAVALAHSFELHERARTCNCNPGEAEQICAANFDNDNVIISHENCDKFYLCSNGKPIAIRCPANLLYNPLIEDCDWPANVDCGDRPISEGSEEVPGSDEDADGDADDDNDGTCNCDPSEAPSICAAEGSDGILVAHENCNQYYMCAHGRPVTFSCGPTLLYHPYTGECDWPQNVECGDRVIPEPDNDAGNDSGNDEDNGNDNDGTCNCNPEEAPIICAAPDSSGVLVAHENCDQYYICENGRPIAVNCPGGLLYNPYTKSCDWPRNVDCGDRIAPACPSCSGSDENDDSPPCDDAGNDSADVNDVPPPGDDTGNDSADIDDVPPPGDDAGNDSVDIDNVPPPGDDAGNDSADVDDVPPPGDDAGNDSADIDDVPPPGDDAGNDSADIDDVPPPGDDADNDSADIDDMPPPGDDAGNDSADIDDVPPPSGDSGNNGTCNCNPEEAPSICAEEDSSGTLVAHENCNQFYICDHGKPVAMTCADNLVYNPLIEQCDWPENVDCGDRVIPDPEDDTGNDGDGNNNDGSDSADIDDMPPPGDDAGNNGTCNCNPEEAPSICAEEDSSGTLVAHENCNQFYICDHGKPVAMTCADHLVFNPFIEQCDWPENVDCGDRVISDPEDDTGNDGDGNNNDGSDSADIDDVPPPGDDAGNNGTCNCNPEEAPSICAEEDSSGTLIAHENCNQFYICDHGKPVAMTCADHLLFNPLIEQCDWPENVDCGDRVIPDPEDDTGNDGDGNDNDGSDSADIDDVLPPGDDAGNDSADIDDVPPPGDDAGNDSADVDDVPPPGDDVGNDSADIDDVPPPGDDSGNNGTCNCNPEEAPSICAEEDSSGTLIAHENCNQFYVCEHGKPVAMTCADHLVFNPHIEQCDWPENVDCGDRVIPDPEDDAGNDSGGSDNDGNDNDGNDSDSNNVGAGNCDPSEAPAICAADDSDDILVAHENCNQYYICADGKPVALICPGNLLFNPNIDQCDWPENVDCGDRVTPNPESDENDSGDIDLPPGNDDGGNDDGGNDDGGNDDGGDDEGGNDEGGNDEGGNDEGGNDDGGNDNSGDDDVGNDDGGNDNGDTDDSDCNDNIESEEECNCNPDEAASICANDDSDNVLIAHEYCNYFYQCANFKPVAIKCPPNLMFNPMLQICDWPSNVDCGDRTIPDSEEDIDASESKEVDDSEGVGDNVGTCNCNPEEAPAICAESGSDGVFIAHENCNQYYQCSSGNPVAMTCGPNTHYNPYIERCDWSSNVECGDRVIPEPDDDNNDNDKDDADSDSNNNVIHDNPSQAPAICANSISQGDFVTHENCNQYYVCAGGLPVEFTCSVNLLFNPLTGECDWSQNVECGDRIIPGDDCACNPRNAPVLCGRPNSDGKLIAHENCNQFYVCIGAVPITRDCPANLYYNPDKEVCDWPQNVQCDSRMQPFASLNKHLESRQTFMNQIL